jgi:hypothetical protein
MNFVFIFTRDLVQYSNGVSIVAGLTHTKKTNMAHYFLFIVFLLLLLFLCCFCTQIQKQAHDEKDLKQLPREGVLAHHAGDGAHRPKAVAKVCQTSFFAFLFLSFFFFFFFFLNCMINARVWFLSR